MARPDRFLITPDWLDIFQDLIQRGHDKSVSDHVMVTWGVKRLDWGPKPFRYVNAWRDHHSFKEEVSRLWREERGRGTPSFTIHKKLHVVKKGLKIWNANTYGNIHTNLATKASIVAELDKKQDMFNLTEQEVIRNKETLIDLARYRCEE